MHSIGLKEPFIKSYDYYLKLKNYNVVIPLDRGGAIHQLVLHVLCLVLQVLCSSRLFSSQGVPGVSANLCCGCVDGWVNGGSLSFIKSKYVNN